MNQIETENLDRIGNYDSNSIGTREQRKNSDAGDYACNSEMSLR